MSKEYTGSSPGEAMVSCTLPVKRCSSLALILLFGTLLMACTDSPDEELAACARLVKGGLLPIADDRENRFMGKVEEDTALCRGGPKTLDYLQTPWVDWSNYWATGDQSTKKEVTLAYD